MRSSLNFAVQKTKGLHDESVQALDLFGARSRNRTGTSLRTGGVRPPFVKAAKARLNAFNRSKAGVRLEMPGRSDLFAERMNNAQGIKDGPDGEYLVDSQEQVFTQSGWSTTIECNAGKKGKANVKGKKPEKPLKSFNSNPNKANTGPLVRAFFNLERKY